MDSYATAVHATEWEDTGEGVSMSLLRESSDTWLIRASDRLYTLSEGRPGAVMLEVLVSEGWCIRTVAIPTADEAESVSDSETASESQIKPATETAAATVGGSVTLTYTLHMGGRRAVVLLDGVFSSDGAGKLVRVTVTPIEDSQDREVNDKTAPPAPCVSVGTGGAFGLYVRSDTGEILRYRLLVEDSESSEAESACSESDSGSGSHSSPETAFSETEGQSPNLRPNDTHAESETEGETDTAGTAASREPSSDGEISGPALAATYVGCRESAVREGYFSVQLLFSGTGATPVSCRQGGESLVSRAEVVEVEMLSHDGKREMISLRAQTYRGLCADQVYVFEIGTPDGTVEVVYRDGQFVRQKMMG